MEITWFGHAAFRLKSEDGVRLIIDPYEPGAFGGVIGYGPIDEEADVVITSHNHADHNYTRDIRGNFTVVDKIGDFRVKAFHIKTIPTFHDASEGKERGKNLLSLIEAEGLRVVHLGDLGHRLSPATVALLGNVHVLLIPIGGFFTIDAEAATQVMKDVGPRITIPMHYRTDKCSLPIADLTAFLKDKHPVVRAHGASLTVTAANLPAEPQVVVLNPAR